MGGNMRKILIVEDDSNIALLINDTLSMANYTCTTVYDGTEALKIILADDFDLILLDVMLAGILGFDLLEKIKGRGIPVIFITALQDVADKVRGLRAGAEDYITKPFEPLELLARVEVVMRRNNKAKNILEYGDIIINVDTRKVTNSGDLINLTNTEFELLVFFVQNMGIAISREKILSSVWNTNYMGETRTIDTHVQNLRRKLDLYNKLIAVPKYGYRLEPQK